MFSACASRQFHWSQCGDNDENMCLRCQQIFPQIFHWERITCADQANFPDFSRRCQIEVFNRFSSTRGNSSLENEKSTGKIIN